MTRGKKAQIGNPDVRDEIRLLIQTEAEVDAELAALDTYEYGDDYEFEPLDAETIQFIANFDRRNVDPKLSAMIRAALRQAAEEEAFNARW